MELHIFPFRSQFQFLRYNSFKSACYISAALDADNFDCFVVNLANGCAFLNQKGFYVLEKTVVDDTPHVRGETFDTPLIMEGGIDYEPERYVAEKPYDLTRYEFSILKKSSSSETWFNLIAGGTAGVVITVAGKTIASLIDKKDPSLATWEIVAVVVGIGISILVKKKIKSDDEKEKEQLLSVVDAHFTQNRKRRVHLTQGGDK
ncbi:hypothetical protein LRP49_19885 [Enterovibrio sp. ZSDZ35]|uniref:Uncharacterized protein n=1 Tax=Enterovibrio qingdaonensis TaxID=2899818 RepID=A0ABT5QR32_9GAMM|nr:hypothetical protein [Enterovibrio sp. ZSDZ35]MDD1783437.1 hypothetical protein [Enterovibrio sp. ZSDZ35]